MTIIWDWNGTLLDDARVCLGVMNGILTRRGLPPLSLERYREIFDFPVKDYYSLAGLDVSGDRFLALADEFMTGYRAASRKCTLVPGGAEVLTALDAMGFSQVLASASRQDDLERQLAEQGLAGRFQAVLGMGDDLGGGKAGLAAGYIRRNGIEPGSVWFVGDTVHDWETAASVGARCVLLAAGHQNKERLAATGAAVLDDIRRLPAFLAAQRV